jgi:exo-beta-1,3-glucanase (GH17 family)
VKTHATQPVTFCENFLPWLTKLAPLVEVVDFISIHTYPVWEYKGIDQAMDYTRQNYCDVANAYPHKSVVITEAGWTTASNGRGIEPHNANLELQEQYLRDLLKWSRDEDVLCFVFEAFDENWKGSDDALEPEKHWGIYRVDRSPKPAAGLSAAAMINPLN